MFWRYHPSVHCASWNYYIIVRKGNPDRSAPKMSASVWGLSDFELRQGNDRVNGASKLYVYICNKRAHKQKKNTAQCSALLLSVRHGARCELHVAASFQNSVKDLIRKLACCLAFLAAPNIVAHKAALHKRPLSARISGANKDVLPC